MPEIHKVGATGLGLYTKHYNGLLSTVDIESLSYSYPLVSQFRIK